MFFAKFSVDGTEHAELYYSTEQYFKDTFSPLTKHETMIPFEIHGKTYSERQNALRSIAIDWSLCDSAGLSWRDYAAITAWFEDRAKQYGLLREFRENAIC